MIHYWGNIIEGAFWITIAGIIYIRMQNKSKRLIKVGRIAIIALFMFGISDFIEVNTGAWYKPFSLLLLKAACIATLLYCLKEYRKD
ncbi:MAG: hypothetical protein L3J71_13930 [Victivallaceae bacterium]|nr:hypothetical protein [Victivallaceae bacterium]